MKKLLLNGTSFSAVSDQLAKKICHTILLFFSNAAFTFLCFYGHSCLNFYDVAIFPLLFDLKSLLLSDFFLAIFDFRHG